MFLVLWDNVVVYVHLNLNFKQSFIIAVSLTSLLKLPKSVLYPKCIDSHDYNIGGTIENPMINQSSS